MATMLKRNSASFLSENLKNVYVTSVAIKRNEYGLQIGEKYFLNSAFFFFFFFKNWKARIVIKSDFTVSQ